MMNRTTCIHHARRLALGLAVVALVASPSFAATINLCATTGTVTMPDGAIVPIWGFVEGTTCAGNATLPGPELRVPAGDTALTINLYNQLGVGISVFIPGQYKPLAPVGGQTVDSRVSSFDAEVAPGGMGIYTWTDVKPGTYLYHSGTDVRTQVPMGLYGALVVEAGPGPRCAYGDGATCDVAYDAEQVLVFSELDPNLNADPANWGGARVSAWEPQYFLINGQAYNPASPSSIPITVGNDVLLRLVSASLEAHVPTLGGGLYAEVVAEDGSLMPHRRSEYGIELHPGKTIDALVNAGSAASYALYDRMLHLTNAGVVGSSGGMFTTLQAATAAGAPIAFADAYATNEDTALNVALPGVLINDTDAEGDPLSAALATDVTIGSLTLNANGSFDYMPAADFNGDAVFTYVANDGTQDSESATVTITVNPVNDAPVAVADAYDTIEGTALIVAAPGVLANDTDIDGDTLTVTTTPVVAPPGLLVLNSDGSFDYTPAGLAGAVETFDYEACDAEPLCSTATVTINVIGPPANQPPTAVDDLFEMSQKLDGFLVIYKTWLASNDVDPDGSVVASSVTVTSPGGITQFGGRVVDNLDGTLTYTPKPGYRGTDSFTYTIDDDDAATSNDATVRINVVK